MRMAAVADERKLRLDGRARTAMAQCLILSTRVAREQSFTAASKLYRLRIRSVDREVLPTAMLVTKDLWLDGADTLCIAGFGTTDAVIAVGTSVGKRYRTAAHL